MIPWLRRASVNASNTKQFVRGYAASARHDPAKIRNMALVAHIDSGKTTLTESILLKSDYLSSSGTVDTGSTTTDFLPAERERGITIQSASIPVKWKHWTYNLIDTPGHADFGMEVESASRVVDGAVVLIDSVEGVEAQTKGVWRQLDRYGVPTRLMFLNKLDRPGASFQSSFLSLLSHRLHPNPVVLTLPIASFDPQNYEHAEPGIEGLVDLVRWDVWKWDSDGQASRHPLPTTIEGIASSGIFPSTHPIIPHLAPARTALLENVSMFSEELMEMLLGLPSEPSSYLGVKAASIVPHLRASTLRNEVLPVLCGAAAKHIGTELVMDYIGELLASPLDVPHEKQGANAPLRALAWKVAWDKRKGWMTFVRIYSGSIKRQSGILNASQNQREKVSSVQLLYADRAEDVESLSFGSVGVIFGLKYTRTGDTLVSTGVKLGSSSPLREIVPPASVMSASVIPQSHSDLGPVQAALESLARTDPSVRIDVQEGQVLMHGLGALHLEIVEGRLRDEFQANFELGGRRVSYRETLSPTAPAEVSDTWDTMISGKPVSATIALAVRRLREDEEGDPAWDGNVVVDKLGKPLPFPESSRNTDDAMAQVAHGLSSTLSTSPNSSLALSHVHIQVLSLEYPAQATSILAGASAVVLRNYLRAAGIGPLMEPYIRLKISVNEDSLGLVIKDLTEHAGEMEDLGSGSSGASDEELGAYPSDGVYVPPAWLSPSSASSPSADSPRLKRSIHAVAPLSQMLDYSNRLRALSGGHGLFEMANAGFREVSDSRALEILKEIGRA
ncbi:hypothetical protein PLICRDRAFT_25697 [Plicaturopsis crispa FD-325 SS-3]|nr:hypothetical protein PLICRDRAFT_25697 [Plicaturopsis crispa FD-325 SS-3]